MNDILKKALQKYKSLAVVAKATMWFLICNVIQKSISLLTTPIFTRIMTTEQYGYITIYNSWFQILLLIVTLRMDYGVFYKGLNKFNGKIDEYTSSMQTFSVIIAVLLLLIYSCVSNIINSFTELSTLLTIFMFFEVMGASAVSYWSAKCRYEYKYKQIVAVTLSISVLNVIFSLICVLKSTDKSTARIIVQAILYFVIGFGLFSRN